MEFNQKLQELRKSKGLTQEDLAEILHVSRTAVSKWESGRGYPNLDSLREISAFFSVTIDELLSCNQVLTIAEMDNKQKTTQLCDLVYGLLDCCVVGFFFLPLFGQKNGDLIKEVSLLSLSGTVPWLKTLFCVIAALVVICGVLTLAMQNCQRPLWTNNKHLISLTLSTVGVLVFIIGRQVYAAAFLFLFLIIKTIILLKK